jgi:hypothetical protein
MNDTWQLKLSMGEINSNITIAATRELTQHVSSSKKRKDNRFLSCFRHPSVSHGHEPPNAVAIVIGQAMNDFQKKLQFMFLNLQNKKKNPTLKC